MATSTERNVQFFGTHIAQGPGLLVGLLVGFVLVIVGLVWLLGKTSTIVMPVILAAVLGAVAGPAVGWLERHRVPRVGGAVLVLLGLVAIGAVIVLLVVAAYPPSRATARRKRIRRWARSGLAERPWSR